MNKKILGMGNAVLDIVASVTDEFLRTENLSKGSMVLVDQEQSDKILKEINPIKKDSGGSVANTIAAISLLGLNSFFCGKVKKDHLGDDFVADMQKTKTKFLCDQSSTGLPTARCIVFVTPDGERSMQTFLGASTTLDEEDIKKDFFNEIDYLLIEGYLWSSKTARVAIHKAIEIAKLKNIKVIFSLSDSNLVKMYKDDFLKLSKSNVNILIGNENEFNELLGDNDLSSFFKTKQVEMIVKTMGQRGVEVFELGQSEIIPSFEVESVIDTTGAGDMFAAGFLYKLLEGNGPKESALFGCKLASQIIKQYGARLTKEDMRKINV
tara:strand:+ start:203 stop:1171 length:969 start_codon:yes stop_codon:yes gene_type:complete